MTARKLRLQAPSALRTPVIGYLERSGDHKRSHAMKIVRGIVMAGVCGLIATTLLAADQGRQEDDDGRMIIARPLVFKPGESDFFLRFAGQGKLTTLEDATAVEKLLGKDTAKPLVKLVDFTKEKIVLVSWMTAGPPEGVLKHEDKGEGKGRRLVFYVQGPAGVQIRGQRASMAADFFAVSKGIAVSFDANERF